MVVKILKRFLCLATIISFSCTPVIPSGGRNIKLRPFLSALEVANTHLHFIRTVTHVDFLLQLPAGVRCPSRHFGVVESFTSDLHGAEHVLLLHLLKVTVKQVEYLTISNREASS